jgi:integrase
MGLHTASERELCDGRVLIYQRTDTMSPVWQVRISFPGQPYIRQSLKTRNEAEAIKLATKLYEDLRYRHESGLPIRRKRFEEVLDLYLGNLAQEVEFGTQKAKKLDDQRKMSRYCREYFEGRLIDTIKTSDVGKFQDWRRTYWVSGPGSNITEHVYQREGKTVKSKRIYSAIPAASTLNSEAVLLRSIFAYAVKHDWIADNQVPDIGEKIPSAKKARDAKRRPGLDREQVQHLLQVAEKRMYEEKENPRLWHQRLMLWAYTGFLAHTGMRPFEAILVRWDYGDSAVINNNTPAS